MTYRDETEFVWAFDANGERVRIPRTHLDVFKGSFKLAPSEKRPKPRPSRTTPRRSDPWPE